MKLPSYENGLSVEFQVDASASEQSTYDQETTSSNVEMLERRNVCNSILGIDPIFLRMVSMIVNFSSLHDLTMYSEIFNIYMYIK